MARRLLVIIPLFALLLGAAPQDTSVDPTLYQEMRYRSIGPFRASRTVGGVGIPSQPNVFYVGVNNGGVWKTDDFGRTWDPIFDDAPTGSIGDLAVSPSDPEVIYVGTGEGLHRPDLAVGDGMFKSTDSGSTWSHIGLPDVQQVARVIVHPTDPDVVFVAGLGHPYGPNEERGVFRTRNGGRTWEKVLYVDHNTGAIQVEFDPNDPDVLFADMWEHREGPWENARFSGPNSGLYKSTDGGDTWRQVTAGLPTAEDGLGRIGVAFAPSDSSRLYAAVDARAESGVYRSDDAGESWSRISTDRRVFGRGSDFAELKVHPRNPDVIFAGNVASYRSDDGGLSWTSIKGAPGGDDYHRIWINPDYPEIMLFVADQGAVVTVNGGRTWSSWYNQPTAQLYHVATDNQFPYWVYGGQQESGAIGTASRGNGGQISFRDWMGIGADEYAYVAPDPKDPDIIYGGRVVRFNKRTGQTQNVAPETLRSGDNRFVRTMPLMFHPADPSVLLFATNKLWKTTTGGDQWWSISPDLADPVPHGWSAIRDSTLPESIGDFRTPEMAEMEARGVIYALGPSPLDVDTIWAGTDDGLIWVTRDGGHTWLENAPPEMRAWDKVSQIDAGHFDTETAYVAINAIRSDDMRPHVYRTHDGGASWQHIAQGMHPMGPVNVVREDPEQPGLLFAGTERQVYFSINDGDSWQSLRQNMPATSIRDLVVHGDDLVIGTHGRSIWILDGIAPLRQLAAAVEAEGPYLYAPGLATRVRWNMFSDTPLPPEEPAGENPPDGAILDYYLPGAAQHVAIEILDPEGHAVARFASDDPVENLDPTAMAYPTYWIRPPQVVSAEPGHHRFAWDMRHSAPAGARRSHSIAAVLGRTPSGPHGPFAAPGTYTVRLTADGVVDERPLTVRMDPRVDISDADIALQSEYSIRAYDGYKNLQAMRDEIDGLLGATDLSEQRRNALQRLRGSGAAGNPDITYGSMTAVPEDRESIVGLQSKFLFNLAVLQSADARPTVQAMAAVRALEETATALEARLRDAR